MREIFCQRCGETHAAHWQRCCFADCPRAPKTREPQPSVEEECHRRQLALTWEIRAKNDADRREAEKAERKATREKAKVQQMFREHDQQEKAAREQATAKTLALMAEMRKDLLVPVKATRQANRLAALEKEQHEKRAAQQAPVQRQAGRLKQREQERTRSRAEARQPMPARGKDQTGETFFDKDFTSRHALEVKLSTGSTKEVT